VTRRRSLRPHERLKASRDALEAADRVSVAMQSSSRRTAWFPDFPNVGGLYLNRGVSTDRAPI